MTDRSRPLTDADVEAIAANRTTNEAPTDRKWPSWVDAVAKEATTACMRLRAEVIGEAAA